MIIPKMVFVFDRRKRATRAKEGSIELCVTADRKRKYITTGITCLPQHWQAGRIVGGSDIKQANDQLHIFIQKAGDAVTKMMEDGMLDLDAIPRLMKGEIQQQSTFLQFFTEEARVRYKGLALGTRKRYEVCINFLRGWNGLVSFADINEQTINRMDTELRKRGLNETTRWNYHKLVKWGIQRAVDNGIIKVNPYCLVTIKRGNHRGLHRLLTPAEFHRFEQCRIEGYLEKVKDLFIFQTYTMMSYSDLVEFDRKKCIVVNGKLVYKACRVKTKVPFTIVIGDEAKFILKKYHNKLPLISNQKYNEYLKVAVKFAGIDKPVTSHYARHTGATLLLNEKNLPMHIIQRMLGHASVRETERTYAKLMDETIVDWLL